LLIAQKISKKDKNETERQAHTASESAAGLIEALSILIVAQEARGGGGGGGGGGGEGFWGGGGGGRKAGG